MPANVTPEFERAEKRYRQATTDDERLTALQEMLATIPKHKGTEKMQADIKHRLSQLRKEQQKPGHSKGPDPFHIPRSGAGQVVLVGPPNAGKSSLLAATTNADAKVADYPFTTTVPQPGMWSRDHVQIELVDTPALTPEHVPVGLMGTIRNADIVCVVVESGDAALAQVECVLSVLKERGLTLCTVPRNRLNPNDPGRRGGVIVVNKAETGAPEALAALRELYAGGESPAASTPPCDEDTGQRASLEGALPETRSAGGPRPEQVRPPQDAGVSGRVLQCQPAAAGDRSRSRTTDSSEQPGLEVLFVSAHTRQGLDAWFQRLWELLAMVRVYAKEPGKPPDMTRPFALPTGSTVADLARLIHRDLPEMMKFARLWGHGRFEGQQVHKTEPLLDRDIVEIHE